MKESVESFEDAVETSQLRRIVLDGRHGLTIAVYAT